MKKANKICGITRGGQKPKVIWWWNDEVKKAIKDKRLLHKKWQKNRDRKSREQYKIKKGEVKAVVAIVKKKMGLKIAKQFE